jgi:nitrogen fixation/metabolism regulation signal transduction histidine kinase
MNASTEVRKRRKLYIKKNFQFNFILKFCLLVVCGAILSTVVLSLLSTGTLTSTYRDSELIIEATSAAILPAVIYTNLITVALIGLATIMVTLFISHKLAGPIYRFETDLETIAAGDLTKTIRLRKNDQLHDFADGLNRMTAGLRAKALIVRDELEQACQDPSLTGDARRRIQAVQQRLEAEFTL